MLASSWSGLFKQDLCGANALSCVHDAQGCDPASSAGTDLVGQDVGRRRELVVAEQVLEARPVQGPRLRPQGEGPGPAAAVRHIVQRHVAAAVLQDTSGGMGLGFTHRSDGWRDGNQHMKVCWITEPEASEDIYIAYEDGRVDMQTAACFQFVAQDEIERTNERLAAYADIIMLNLYALLVWRDGRCRVARFVAFQHGDIPIVVRHKSCASRCVALVGSGALTDVRRHRTSSAAHALASRLGNTFRLALHHSLTPLGVQYLVTQGRSAPCKGKKASGRSACPVVSVTSVGASAPSGLAASESGAEAGAVPAAGNGAVVGAGAAAPVFKGPRGS